MSMSISFHKVAADQSRYGSAALNKNNDTNDEDGKLKYDDIDKEISELQDQKQNLEDQIRRLSGTAKSQEENKDLISELKSQVEILDSEIEEKKAEKIKKSTNSSDNSKKAEQDDKGGKTVKNINNNLNIDDEKQAALNSNMVIFSQEVSNYKQFNTLNHIRKSLKAEAVITRDEARMDGLRNRAGDAKKYMKAAQDDLAARKLDSRISEKIKDIDKDNNKIKNNIKDSDSEKQADKEKESQIDVLV